MLESIVITLFPVLFLIVLFGGGMLFLRKKIDIDGKPPIDKMIFYVSKYLIVIVWASMVVQGWGVNLSVITVSGALKWISLCLWVMGFLLLFLGRFGMGSSFRLGSPNERTRLKVDGLFKFSRNPMYLGVFTSQFAAVLYTLNPVVLALVIFIVAVHHRIVLAEEEYLRKMFGQEYVDYCSSVRRYL